MRIPTAVFGRTGHVSSRVIFGGAARRGAALAQVSQDVADRTLDVLLSHDVNHIDVAASYGDAELRVRPWLHRSLDRLGVDHIDLWQFHSLADPIEWDTALSPGDAIEAAVQAREEGLVRWIGVTGHGSQIAATHRRSLARFDFDSVLLPYNYVTMQLPYYAENFEALTDTCRERGVAVQTIKSVARRPWAGRPHTRATWYEPLEDQDDIDLAVWWALARPEVFLNSIGDVDLLPRVLAAASRFTHGSEESAMADLMDRSSAEPSSSDPYCFHGLRRGACEPGTGGRAG